MVGGAADDDRDVPREALHLDAARQLGADREPGIAGRECDERQHDDGDRGRGEHDPDEGLPDAAAPRDVDRKEREQEERVELRGDRSAERHSGQTRPPAQERRDRERGERDGERVEACQRELPEQEGRRADEAERDRGVPDGGGERAQRDGGQHHRRGQEQGHERGERPCVTARGVVHLGLVDRVLARRDERGQHEGGKGARRVLDADVAVRHVPRDDPVAERLVQRDIPRGRVVRPGPGQRSGREEERQRGDGEHCEVAPRRRPPHGREAKPRADRRGTVPAREGALDRASRLASGRGAPRPRGARELRRPSDRVAARAGSRLVGLLALVPPGGRLGPAVFRPPGLPDAGGAACHRDPDVARRSAPDRGRVRVPLRALAPRLGLGGRPDLAHRRPRGRSRVARHPDVRRPVPRGLERPGLRLSPRLVVGGGRACVEHGLRLVAGRGGARRRAPHVVPPRGAGRDPRLRPRPARRAARHAADPCRRSRRARGSDRPPGPLGRAERGAVRRLHGRARQQGVGAVLPRRGRRRPGERPRVAEAGGRGRAERPHAAPVQAPGRGHSHVLPRRREPRGDPDDRPLRPGLRLGHGLRRAVRRVDGGDSRRPLGLRARRRRHVLGLPLPALCAGAAHSAGADPRAAGGADDRRQAIPRADHRLASRPGGALRVRLVPDRRPRALRRPRSAGGARRRESGTALHGARRHDPGLERAAADPRPRTRASPRRAGRSAIGGRARSSGSWWRRSRSRSAGPSGLRPCSSSARSRR